MTTAGHLLSRRLLASNVVWSFAGAALPLLVGIWAIPHLIDGLGKERFGLLAIIWMGIGYFSLFDLGIGRALTKLVSERLGNGQTQELPALIRAGLRLMWWLGLFSAVAVIFLTHWLVTDVLSVSAKLQHEGKWSFWILASTLPFVVNTAGLIGILQAYQRFRAITAIRLPLGLANFIGPALALLFTDSLIATTATIAVSRVLAWAAYAHICMPYRGEGGKASGKPFVRSLLAYGGWITVSNVVGPLMVYFDRLVIGSVLGLLAVSYYATPYEVVTRLWVFPNAIADVLFPALAAALVAHVAKAREIYVRAALVQFVVMFPAIMALTLLAYELLDYWVGEDFAINSTQVLNWLALGVYINGFARMPYALLQSHGRPDLTAKLHLVELPLYLWALWWMMGLWGIEGAAIAWTARIIFDTVALFVFAAKYEGELARVQYKVLTAVTASSVLLAGSWFIEAFAVKLALAIGVLVAGVMAVYPAVRPFVRSS